MSSSVQEKLSGIPLAADGRHALAVLNDAITVAKIEHTHGENDDAMPIVEAPLEVCEYYNRGNIAGFRKAGYFIMQDVLVCPDGTGDAVREALDRDLRDVPMVTVGSGMSGGAPKKK